MGDHDAEAVIADLRTGEWCQYQQIAVDGTGFAIDPSPTPARAADLMERYRAEIAQLRHSTAELGVARRLLVENVETIGRLVAERGEALRERDRWRAELTLASARIAELEPPLPKGWGAAGRYISEGVLRSVKAERDDYGNAMIYGPTTPAELRAIAAWAERHQKERGNA